MSLASWSNQGLAKWRGCLFGSFCFTTSNSKRLWLLHVSLAASIEKSSACSYGSYLESFLMFVAREATSMFPSKDHTPSLQQSTSMSCRSTLPGLLLRLWTEIEESLPMSQLLRALRVLFAMTFSCQGTGLRLCSGTGGGFHI